MEQIGEVVFVEGDMARIRVKRHDVCSKCGGCGAALLGKGENFIDAKNAVNAKVGHIVRISSDTGKVLKASFMVYMIPMLFLLAGLWLGQALAASLGIWREDLAGFVLGVVFMLASYGLVRAYDRRQSPETMKTTVVEILEESVDRPEDEQC